MSKAISKKQRNRRRIITVANRRLTRTLMQEHRSGTGAFKA